jgi:NADH-quinone oxidoreductase subunit M
VLALLAIGGVVLGALYMLRFAAKFLYGEAKAPHGPVADLVPREKAILVALIAAVFWLGLFPDEPMRKTEVAAREYQLLVRTSRLPALSTAQAAPAARALAPTTQDKP